MTRISLVFLLSTLVAPLLGQEPASKLAPPGTEPQTSGAQQAADLLNLDDVVREALQNNPAIASAQHSAQALQHKIPQARSLADPTASLGWMGDIAPFKVQDGDPSSYRAVGVMQQFPYPGKLKLRGEIATKEAQAGQSDLEAVRRRIATEAKAAYYDYFYYGKAIDITRKDKDLLQKLSSISEARYRVGKGMQQDVLKSQLEISLLLQKLTKLEQQRAEAQARLNTVMGRPVDTPLPPAAEVEPAALNEPLEALYAAADKNDTGLEREQRMAERNQLAVQLAQKDYRPDLGVAYMYEQRPGMSDMHGVTFSVNIPVFYKSKQREEVRQASEEWIAAQRSHDSRRLDVQFELKQSYLAAQASKQLIDLYSKAVVPQSSLALESSMAAYQVGNVDFLTVLANFTTVLDYEVEYYRELADYQTSLARMESLAGLDLTSARPLPSDGGANSDK